MANVQPTAFQAETGEAKEGIPAVRWRSFSARQSGENLHEMDSGRLDARQKIDRAY